MKTEYLTEEQRKMVAVECAILETGMFGAPGDYKKSLERLLQIVGALTDRLHAETQRRIEAEEVVDILCDDDLDMMDADLLAKSYRLKFPKE